MTGVAKNESIRDDAPAGEGDAASGAESRKPIRGYPKIIDATIATAPPTNAKAKTMDAIRV